MALKIKYRFKTLIMYQIYIDDAEKNKISKQKFFYQHPLRLTTEVTNYVLNSI